MKIKAKRFKLLMLMTVMTVMLFGNSLTVFAAVAGTDSTISNYIASCDGNLKSSISSYFKVFDDVNAMNASCDTQYNYYTCSTANGTMYYAILQTQEQDVVSTIQRMADSSNVTNNINTDVLGGFSVSADTATASGLLVGFQKPLATFLGIITIILTAGMTFFTALDLCYIAFPVFRERCDDKKASGGMGTKQGKDGNTKLTFITDDAQYAVTAADTVQSGKSPFVIYLKKRALAFVLLAIVIFILLTGNIGIFATLALKLVQGLLDFLQGFN